MGFFFFLGGGGGVGFFLCVCMCGFFSSFFFFFLGWGHILYADACLICSVWDYFCILNLRSVP